MFPCYISELQSREQLVLSVLLVKQWQLVLKVNRSYGVGRQATSEDTSEKTRHVYSELRVVKCIHCN
jgi:hypothetical protein